MAEPVITLHVQHDDVRDVVSQGSSATASGACPKCEASPFRIAGAGMRTESRDTYAADGACLSCKASVGTIRAVVSTLFGIEEDERVTSGPWKVY